MGQNECKQEREPMWVNVRSDALEKKMRTWKKGFILAIIYMKTEQGARAGMTPSRSDNLMHEFVSGYMCNFDRGSASQSVLFTHSYNLYLVSYVNLKRTRVKKASF